MGIDGLAAELGRLRRSFASSSPPYARALALLPSVLDGPAGRFVAAAWEQRRFRVWSDRPLLVLTALRNDALREGPSHPLWAGLAAPEPQPDAVTEAALRAALHGSREGVFDALAHGRVQVNDASQAVAWLWPAALAGASDGAREIALAEVGASAGLNLVADALPGIWTDDSGAPVEIARSVRIVSRLGLDLAPLDALSESGARWLRASLPPGQPAREARLGASVEAFRTARTRLDAPVLVPIAVPNVPARLDALSAAYPGALVVAYQTVLRDHLERDERKEYEAGMRSWLGTQPPGRALWVEHEPAREGEAQAIVVAHVRAPGGEPRDLRLGRCSLHPSTIERRPGAEAELRALLRQDVQAGARA